MNREYADIKFVGLTGQTGAGKTTAGEFFVDNGYGVINCDLVSRKVVSDGTSCLSDLVSEFGIEILKADGRLDRKRLAEIVFTNEKKLLTLNEIIFPYILEKITTAAKQLIEYDFKVIVFDAPTLFESEFDKMCDIIISVVADKQIRLSRIIERDNISIDLANARINSQYDDTFYAGKSDFVLTNDGDRAEFTKQLIAATQFISSYIKVV